MGIGGFFRTPAYYEYHPEKGVRYYRTQVLGAMFGLYLVRFMAVVISAVLLIGLVGLFVRKDWHALAAQGLVPAIIFLLLVVAAKEMASYPAFLVQKLEQMHGLIEQGADRDDGFRPEDVDWT